MKQESINKRFTNLCAMLGEIEFRLKVLTERRDALVSELKQMDVILPALIEQDKALEQAQQTAAQQALLASKLSELKSADKKED